MQDSNQGTSLAKLADGLQNCAAQTQLVCILVSGADRRNHVRSPAEDRRRKHVRHSGPLTLVLFIFRCPSNTQRKNMGHSRWYTPGKFNIQTNNGGLEKVTPFKSGDYG